MGKPFNANGKRLGRFSWSRYRPDAAERSCAFSATAEHIHGSAGRGCRIADVIGILRQFRCGWPFYTDTQIRRSDHSRHVMPMHDQTRRAVQEAKDAYRIDTDSLKREIEEKDRLIRAQKQEIEELKRDLAAH